MELANYIETAMKSILKNPIYEVLSEIKITKILKQSNFVKREVGYPPFQIILHSGCIDGIGRRFAAYRVRRAVLPQNDLRQVAAQKQTKSFRNRVGTGVFKNKQVAGA